MKNSAQQKEVQKQLILIANLYAKIDELKIEIKALKNTIKNKEKEEILRRKQ